MLEFLPGGAARLIPIALWMDGKYYDASMYGANPQPMALAPGTVYEAQENGEATGIFVVNTPKLVNGSWVGDGHWTLQLSLDAKIAAEKAKQPKPKAADNRAIFTGGPDEGPPVLRRGGAESSGNQAAQSGQQPNATQEKQPTSATTQASSGGSEASGPQPTASADSGRPTLKRPSDEEPTTGNTANSSSSSSSGPTTSDDANRPVLHRSPSSEASTTSSDNNDPDRPILRKPGQSTNAAGQASAASSASSTSADDNDPDRPLLARGEKSAGKSSVSTLTAPPGTPANPKPTKSAAPVALRAYPAISDAGKYELRSLLYAMSPEQKQQLSAPMLAYALADLRAFAAKRPGPQIPKTFTISDYDLRIFDLDFSNSPTLVLDAKLPMESTGTKPFAYYATIVAHLDINGEPQKIFSSVTDTAHLDVYSRLELIDALDADSNGRGDLLFRQYSDTGINYGLYRVFPYQMEKIFEGGSSL